MGLGPPQGYSANQLLGPIYAPDGSILYDPRSDGALSNASKITEYPLILGTDVSPASNIQQSAALSGTNTYGGTQITSLGGGITIVAQSSQMFLTLWALCTNSTADDGLILYLYRSTTGIPASGDAPGGSDAQLSTYILRYVATAAQEQSSFLADLDMGLTKGTTYYYYPALSPLSGGEAQVNSAYVTAVSV